MKKVFQLLVLFMGVSFLLSNVEAQPKIQFSEESFDFGTIAEKGGLVSHNFEFKNVGDAPLLIQRVGTSCGCTSPKWTRTPIEPGQKGIIEVTYNPLHRPGKFNKSITVYSNISDETGKLKITGTVESAPRDMTLEYPIKIDALRLKSKSVYFNEVNKGEVKTAFLYILNDSKANATVSVENLDSGIAAEAIPSMLKPGQSGIIQFTLDSKNINEWGHFTKLVWLKINGVAHKVAKNEVSIRASIVEDFSKMTIQEKRDAPIVEIKSRVLEFGTIKQGKKVRGKIQIKNIGKNPLQIRKVKNDSKEIYIKNKNLVIKSGKKGQLSIYIDTKNVERGTYERNFRIITNDPTNATILYKIKYAVR